MEAVRLLLDEGECSPDVANHKMSRPLHVAAINGRTQVVQLLLQHPDTDVVSFVCITPSHSPLLIVRNIVLQHSSPPPNGRAYMIKLLLQHPETELLSLAL